MIIEKARRLITQKENIRLEFKVASNALPSNLFETICAMLNRDGSDIILGVTDNNVLQGMIQRRSQPWSPTWLILNEGLKSVLKAIQNNPGIQANKYLHS